MLKLSLVDAINQAIRAICDILKLIPKKNIGVVRRMELIVDFKLLLPLVNPLKIENCLMMVDVLEMKENF